MLNLLCWRRDENIQSLLKSEMTSHWLPFDLLFKVGPGHAYLDLKKGFVIPCLKVVLDNGHFLRLEPRESLWEFQSFVKSGDF